MTRHRPPEQWLVLSDRAPDDSDGAPSQAPAPSPEIVESGMFVVELALPLEEPAVLLDFHSQEGWPRTFTLFHDPGAGFVLIHRQGQSVARHKLPGTLVHQVGTGRLRLRFNAPERVWDMQFEYLDGAGAGKDRLVSHGQNPLPIRPDDLHGLSRQPARSARHGAVLWFGLTSGGTLPARAPWIGQRTPLETGRGLVLAGHLKPGDLVATADGGLTPLRRSTRLDLPACGSFAPVILRAPYFGTSTDLLVASDQRVGLSGPEVEYLFGEDEVLVEAGALVDGRSALSEKRRAVASVLILEFDHPALVIADGCPLLVARADQTPLHRMLQGYEVLTLMALMGRAGHRRSA